METALFTLLGTLIGGMVTYLLQRQQFAHQLKLTREQNKTEFIAESTAHYFLSHQGYTDRSFEALKKHLGGFEDDELRKILVRAGAMRTYREDNSEWWRLLSRHEEYIKKKTEEQAK